MRKYFHFNGDQYQISDEIRQMVKFNYLNLAKELPYSELDLMLMRNVTIYFDREFIEALSVRCQRSLREGGWFIVGASELNQKYYGNFLEVAAAGATLYQKNSQYSSTVDKRTNPLSFSLSIDPLTMHKPNFSELPVSPTISRTGALPPLSRSSDSKPLSKSNPLSTRPNTGSLSPLVDHYQEAEKLFQKNDLVQAEQILHKIMDKDVRAQLLMAKIASQRGNNSACERYLRIYLKSEPDSLVGHYLLGLICLEDNRLADAAAEFRYTTYLDRDFAMGYWQLGLVYQRQSETILARRNFLQARRIISALPIGSQVEYSDGQNAAFLLQTIDTLLQGVPA